MAKHNPDIYKYFGDYRYKLMFSFTKKSDAKAKAKQLRTGDPRYSYYVRIVKGKYPHDASKTAWHLYTRHKRNE